MIFYAGDCHGRLDAIKKINQEALDVGVTTVIQVGDFGVLFEKDCKVAQWFNDREAGPNWLTCGGNHDNWDAWLKQPQFDFFGTTVHMLAIGCFYVPRGEVIRLFGKRFLFFGGAESIDRHHRVEGKDWWSQETPDSAEFYEFYDSMEAEKPDIIITHDAPSRVPVRKRLRNAAPTPQGLEQVMRMSEHKPDRWYFGHHHIMEEWEIEGTKFYCCGLHGEYQRHY